MESWLVPLSISGKWIAHLIIHTRVGGTHIFVRMGMCRLFTKKPQTWVPFFTKKILKHGSTFLTEPKFSGFCMVKIKKFLKNGPIFQEKILKKWVPFSAKITLKDG